ncbi:MAG: ATP-binding protein, partial [Gammaproteobacteria bacterium]
HGQSFLHAFHVPEDLFEPDQGIVDKKAGPLRTVVEEINQALQPTMLQKGLTFAIEIGDSAVVSGERFLVRQALFNVVENAVAFSPDEGRIDLTAIVDKDQVVVKIRDRGPGIPDYAKERVFERFYSLQRPGGRSRSSGLGLSFVKEVMDLHGGSVALNSGSEGTEAVLRFPLYAR